MPEDPRPPAPSRALRDRGLRPRKRLGQNFLQDRRYLKRILEAAEVGPEDAVLEIGAGTGVLTRELAREAGRVVAIELDERLYQMLEDQVGTEEKVRMWHGDALRFDPCDYFDGPYKVVGNIPYYITGPILRHFLEAECRPEEIVLMVQREVAERMVAEPGELSLLGVSVQYYAQPRIVTRVPAGAFYPRPKVESAIVHLRPHPEAGGGTAAERFFQVARAGFGTRRKTLLNSLGLGLGMDRTTTRDLLTGAGIDENRRAETLTIDEWKQLAACLATRAG
jgi:16S rRNA (adenine1518-N6/adenine1519-N6)-dimethyltransferase